MKTQGLQLTKLVLTVFTAAALALGASGCDKGKDKGKGQPAGETAGEQGAVNTEKKLLASNVVYMDAQQALALQDPSIDTTTKVLAQNVMFANGEGKSDLKSNNVEGALVESNLDLKKLVPGKWNKTLPGLSNYKEELQFSTDGKASRKVISGDLSLTEEEEEEESIGTDEAVNGDESTGNEEAVNGDESTGTEIDTTEDVSTEPSSISYSVEEGLIVIRYEFINVKKKKSFENHVCFVVKKLETKLIVSCNGQVQIWTR